MIKNGNVWLENGPKATDLLLENWLIADIGRIDYRIEDCDIIDASRLDILPGLIDIHTHLDDTIGNFQLADTWTSGSEIAILNGITTLCSFITQRPDSSLQAAVERALKKAENRSYSDYSYHLTPLSFERADWAYIEKLMADGFRTFKFYTTYRQAGLFVDYRKLKELMQRLAEMEAGVLVHCEDESILERARDGIINNADPYSHALSRPPEAEIEAVKRVLEIVDRTGGRTHIVHVSAPRSAEYIAEARQDLPVSCETCPQYLFLSEEKLREENGHRFICSPPLRSEEDRKKLYAIAQNKGFDIYATDHCAFWKEDKDRYRQDFRNIPNGLPGIGALVPLIYELHRDLQSLLEHLSSNPAKIAGLYPQKGIIRKGADADLLIINKEGRARNIQPSLSDVYDPYSPRTTQLEVKTVFLRGRKVVDEGRICQSSPGGRRV